MRWLAMLLCLLVGCAARVEGEETPELDVKTEALNAQGCHGFLEFKPTPPPGLMSLPWFGGSVWEFDSKAGNVCRYRFPFFEYLYGPTSSSCAQVDNRTWYCGGFGVVSCAASVSLQRPIGASDNLLGPYTTALGRYNYPLPTSLPFHSSRMSGNRVECVYNAQNTTFAYERRPF